MLPRLRRHPRHAARRVTRAALTVACGLLAFAAAAIAGRIVHSVLAPPAARVATVTTELGGMTFVAGDTWLRAELPRSISSL